MLMYEVYGYDMAMQGATRKSSVLARCWLKAEVGGTESMKVSTDRCIYFLDWFSM